MKDYFDEVAVLLREHGVREGRARELIDDLTAYTEESGTDPVAEFGPPNRFAAELTTTAEEDTGDDPDVFRWACDAFSAPGRLNEMGAQGWEVEKVDALGRFVSHRAPDRPQTWEYRQEITIGSEDRARLTERLAPEGWEPCGHWSVLTYFKRPMAAEVGPAAELAEVPENTGRRFVMGWTGLLVVIACLSVSGFLLYESVPRLLGGDVWSVLGALTGMASVLGLLWLGSWVYKRVRERG